MQVRLQLSYWPITKYQYFCLNKVQWIFLPLLHTFSTFDKHDI